MEKYRFNRKLQEAALKRRVGKHPIITINGEGRQGVLLLLELV